MLTLARVALARPLLVLALLAIATAAVAKGLFRLELRTDGAAIYPQGNQVVERTLADRQLFHEADQIIVLATSRPGGPPLASVEGFRYLQQLQRALARFPGVETAGVRSAVTLIDPPETLRPLRLFTFFQEWSGDDRNFAEVLARMRKLPVTSGIFLAADGTAAAFYAPVGRRTTRTALLADLRRYLGSRGGSPFLLRLTGPVAAEVDLGEVVVRDLSRLVPIMVAAVALLLALSLRTAGGVLIPLAQVLATLVWTLGLMGWAGVPVTLVTTVMPVLLMAMAMTDEIYLIERLQDHLAVGAPAPGGERERLRRAAERAFADLATPLVLISLATAAGFFSFLGASMAPLRHLGLFTGVGLLLGMLFTFTLAPALMVTLPASWMERRRRRRPDRLADGMFGFERLTARRPRAVALATVGLLAVAVPGLMRLRVEDSWIDNFDPRSPLVTAARRFDAAFWGSYRFDVVCSGAPGYFWTPPAAALLEELQRWADRAPHVGGMVSMLPPFEAGAHALGLPRPLSALPPRDLRRVGMLVEALRIRLYLKDLLALDGDHLRARLLVRNADYSKARELAASFAAELPRLLAAAQRTAVSGGVTAAGAAAAPLEIHASGEVAVALAVVSSIVGNQLRSIGWTAVLIAVMLLAALRSLRWTAVVMAPVLGATLLLFAGLGYAGVPLGIATSMFAALNLGAGVDFGVQYVYAYRRERRAGLPHAEAVAAALRTTGRGLRWNALVLAFGIAVLGLSAIKPNSSLGLLLALAMLVSYATTLALLPELLRRVAGERRQRPLTASPGP
jgi:predicted RND superfamily exporter protein